MYTYLLKNTQGQFETTKLRLATRKQAKREAEIWAKHWLGLTGEYIVLQVKNIKKC